MKYSIQYNSDGAFRIVQTGTDHLGNYNEKVQATDQIFFTVRSAERWIENPPDPGPPSWNDWKDFEKEEKE